MNVVAHGREYTWQAMASPVSLRLPDLPDTFGLAVARAVAEDIEATEQALSRFRESAELVRLNAAVGRWMPVSWRLYDALSASWRAYRRTGGLFDPRVLGSLEAIGYAGAAHPPVEPSDDPVWLGRRPRPRTVRLMAPLDLGGIGKGLAVRWGARIVERVAGNYLLNAGGDLLADGPGPDGDGWHVGVEDPREPSRLLAVLRTRTRTAICTSSISRLRWRYGNNEVHHLIDPRSGKPGGAGLLAVTVMSHDPAWTEVWSKALFLRGGDGIADAARDTQALWVLPDGRVGCGERMSEHLIWQREAGSDLV